MWSREELERYSRHMILPEIGPEGQARLKRSSVLVIGAGGLGSPLLLYLAASGVGRIGIVEHDVVDLSNLQRQILFGTAAIGRYKAEVARERMLDLNPHLEIQAYTEKLTNENAIELFSQYDLIADASDNFPTRYLANDAAVLAGKPLVHGSIHRFDGQVAIFHYQGGPCYRCLFPKPPDPDHAPNCAQAGVFGVLPGVIGSLMATEALKVLLGIGRPLSGRLLLYDGLEGEFRELNVERKPDCPVCGNVPRSRSS